MSRSKPKDPNFPGMPPIPRLHRPWIITEKINGTNGLVAIHLEGDEAEQNWPAPLAKVVVVAGGSKATVCVRTGSKNQWLGPDGDNFGFGRWVAENAFALANTLGEGLHRGEWWGSGIQTGYGLPKGEKRFSLFNTWRWDEYRVELGDAVKGLGCVPVLASEVDGHALNLQVNTALRMLEIKGSLAAPGFMRPEGVVAFQPSSQAGFKATIHNDEIPKGLVGRE